MNISLCLVVYEGRLFDCAFDNEPPICDLQCKTLWDVVDGWNKYNPVLTGQFGFPVFQVQEHLNGREMCQPEIMKLSLVVK